MKHTRLTNKTRTEEKTYSFIVVCPFCNKENKVVLTEDQTSRFIDYRTKKDMRCIQQIFPDLNAEQRELLKTGMCNDCWEEYTKDFD